MTTATQPQDRQGEPRLRRSLRLVRTKSIVDGLPKCYLRNPDTDEIFDLGQEAAFVCANLDGEKSPATIRALYEEQFGVPLAREDFEILVRQLARRGLLEGQEASTERTLPEIFDPHNFLPIATIRLGSGDRLLAFLARKLRWLFTTPFQVVAVATILGGLFILVTDFFELAAAIARRMSPGFLLLVLASASVLVHSARSFVHGLSCKRHARQVRDLAVSFLYYVFPAITVDWREMAWIPVRSQRFWAIFSGLYYQMILCGLALIGWRLTTPGAPANTVFLAVALSSGLGLILFNANPLTKMDAYLLLVNWTGVHRLRERSLAALGAWLHGDPPPEVLSTREKRWFVTYGLLCSGYAVLHIALFFTGVWRFMTPTFRGQGALLTSLLFLFAVHKPMGHYMAQQKTVRWLFLDNKLRRRILLWSTVAIVTAVGFLPYPYEVSGPFRLLPAARYEIRTEVEGMVDEVLVREGQWVQAGDPVLRLIERDYETRALSAMSRLDEAQAKLDLLKKGATPEEIRTAQAAVETAAAQAAWSQARAERFRGLYDRELISAQEWENAQQAAVVDERELEEAKAFLALTQQGAQEEAVAALQAEVDSLQAVVDIVSSNVERTTVSTPIEGRIVTPRVQELEGRYVKPGQREVTVDVEDSRMMYAEVLVPEQNIGSIARGARVRLVTWAYHDEKFLGEVVEIAPVATVSADFVVDGSDMAVGDPDSKVVRVTTEIPNPDDRLKSEMTGYAKIATEDRLVWDVLLRPIYRWFRVEFWSWIP
jgi:putative peptide zinc metalloprotease protein